MSALEVKEKDLNKLKAKVDTLLKNNHPASDKIEVWTDPLIMCIYGDISDHFTFMYYVWEPYLFCVCASLQAYRDTLQTQWSWLLQITKCIDVHLKENAAYNQVTGQNVQLIPNRVFTFIQFRSNVMDWMDGFLSLLLLKLSSLLSVSTILPTPALKP